MDQYAKRPPLASHMHLLESKHRRKHGKHSKSGGSGAGSDSEHADKSEKKHKRGSVELKESKGEPEPY